MEFILQKHFTLDFGDYKLSPSEGKAKSLFSAFWLGLVKQFTILMERRMPGLHKKTCRIPKSGE